MRIAAFLENIEDGAREAGKSAEVFLRELKALGLESVYMNFSRHLKPREEEIMGLLHRLGLTLEGLWDNLDFHAMTPQDAHAAYCALVDCAARNGAGHVLITPGLFYSWESGRRVSREEIAAREPEMQRMIAAVARAKAYGDAHGVAVTLEDYDGFGAPIVYPEVLRRFYQEIPGLLCSFDTGNFVPCDGDVMAEFDFYRHRLAAIHLKDRKENDDFGGTEKAPYITQSGRKYYAAPVGSGDMHIPEILKALQDQGYTGGLIAELYGSTDIARKLPQSIRWLKEQLA